MSENTTNIAVIGLGAMGLPMATHLATIFSVTGFDPFEPRRALAADRGVAAEVTPAGASKNADIALLAVRDQSQAESALFGENGVLESLRSGSPVILTSTVGPEAVRALAERLERLPDWTGLTFSDTAGMRTVLRAEGDDFDPLEALGRYYGSEPRRMNASEAAQGALV